MEGKRNRVLIVVLAALAMLLALTGCSTAISLRTLVPAEVNVSGYKTIAVQSTSYDYSPSDLWWRNFFIPIRGNVDQRYIDDITQFTLFDGNTANSVTRYASNRIVKSIDQGYFDIKSPELTDSLITVGKNFGTVRKTLMDNGIDALLTSKISYMNYDEYITSEPVYSNDGKKAVVGYRFYLIQSASISLSYTVIDVENNVVIGSDTLTKSCGPFSTLIGHTNDAWEYVTDRRYYELDHASELFEGMIKDFASSITRKLTPHYETSYFEFMSNKPKVKSLEDAYKFVDDDNYKPALDLFVAEYNRSGHVAAGYNAAVLYYALGQYDEAFSMALKVYESSGNSDALDLYYRLKSIRSNQEAARDQIYGTKKATSSSDELIGF